MPSGFSLVGEDFAAELLAITSVVQAFGGPGSGNPRARVAAANSSILLLAATFEEFVRECAREHAREVVRRCQTPRDLPVKLLGIAWKRTLEGLARANVKDHESVPADAMDKFVEVYEFVRGDLGRDIYQELIHNENNMRPAEINGLFKLSGLKDVCQKVSGRNDILIHFGETDSSKTNGLLVSALEKFFEKRNQTAHSINTMRSSGPSTILQDIALLRAFADALVAVLDEENDSGANSLLPSI